jgi:hypothetical protein
MDWQKDVHTYLVFCKTVGQNLIRPAKCSYCEHFFLHAHGIYYRQGYTQTEHISILIYRFLCPSCGKTVSVIPSFVGKKHTITWDAQEEIFGEIEECQALEEAGKRILPPVAPLSSRTLLRWKRRWKFLLEAAEPVLWEWALKTRPARPFLKGKQKAKTRYRWLRWVWEMAQPGESIVGLFHAIQRFGRSPTLVNA